MHGHTNALARRGGDRILGSMSVLGTGHRARFQVEIIHGTITPWPCRFCCGGQAPKVRSNKLPPRSNQANSILNRHSCCPVRCIKVADHCSTAMLSYMSEVGLVPTGRTPDTSLGSRSSLCACPWYHIGSAAHRLVLSASPSTVECRCSTVDLDKLKHH
ncbi:hypothetical protein BDZ91DRAFT_731698, partial [Kalaharituber pfeilii]